LVRTIWRLKMSRKHRVKSHHWSGGVLQTMDHLFDSLEEALSFANAVESFHVKVYSDDGELVHSATSNELAPSTETYA